jgi:tyrosyl-tRNA synthetase
VPITALVHLQRRGGRPVVLVGGGTGMIGDPSGTSAERNLLDPATLEANLAGIRSQLERFLAFDGPNAAVIVNNLDWLSQISMIEFLRDVGKHFTIPYMLSKDSVQTRLGGGLSFTEFSYMLLQAADFQHLYRTLGVELQMGGADQWGNITAGLELIRRTEGGGDGAEGGEDLAHALAFTLLLDERGAKFGKTAAGTSVWLDAERTTPYAFYQYWLGQPDDAVGRLLRFFTLLDRTGDRGGRARAGRVTRGATRPAGAGARGHGRVHGETAAREAERQSREVFSGGLLGLSEADFQAAIQGLTVVALDGPVAGAGATAVAAGAASSNGEARRLIAQGGLYVNDRRVEGFDDPLPGPVHGRYWSSGPARRTSGSSSAPAELAGAVAQDRDHLGRGEVALGEHDERVVQQVGGLARQGRAGRVARCAGRLRRGIVLGGDQDLGGLLGHLAGGRVDAAIQQAGRVGASGRVAARSAIVDQSSSSQAKPWVRARGVAVCRVKARSGAAVTCRAGRIGGHEQRVGVAVRGDVDDSQRVAARLALLPERVARSRVEVDVAGRERRVERLAVHPGEHQHLAVGGIADDRRDETVAAEANASGSITRRWPGPTAPRPPSRP